MLPGLKYRGTKHSDDNKTGLEDKVYGMAMSDLVTLENLGEVSLITLDNDDNKWTTTLVREIDAALDEIEKTQGPHAVVTASSNPKFFSNGLDLEWVMGTGEHPGGVRKPFAEEFMKLAARMITFPMPTVCAVNGHAFGAGFMWALCHDQRIMRQDRGLLCANEVEIGMAIPEPELALFHHKMPQNVFYETVQLARRWTGEAAYEAGIFQSLAQEGEVTEAALKSANQLSKLAKRRDVFGWMKEHIWGENAAIKGPHGPAHMLRNMHDYAEGPQFGS